MLASNSSQFHDESSGHVKVLVIDDDAVARELLVSILREGGHETFELHSPIGATQIIAKEGLDAVVLDVLMPAFSGDKLAMMLRSNPRLSHLIIVLVSSCDKRELDNLAKQVHADAVVSKRDARTTLLPAIAARSIAAQSVKGDAVP